MAPAFAAMGENSLLTEPGVLLRTICTPSNASGADQFDGVRFPCELDGFTGALLGSQELDRLDREVALGEHLPDQIAHGTRRTDHRHVHGHGNTSEIGERARHCAHRKITDSRWHDESQVPHANRRRRVHARVEHLRPAAGGPAPLPRREPHLRRRGHPHLAGRAPRSRRVHRGRDRVRLRPRPGRDGVGHARRAGHGRVLRPLHRRARHRPANSPAPTAFCSRCTAQWSRPNTRTRTPKSFAACGPRSGRTCRSS